MDVAHAPLLAKYTSCLPTLTSVPPIRCPLAGCHQPILILNCQGTVQHYAYRVGHAVMCLNLYAGPLLLHSTHEYPKGTGSHFGFLLVLRLRRLSSARSFNQTSIRGSQLPVLQPLQSRAFTSVTWVLSLHAPPPSQPQANTVSHPTSVGPTHRAPPFSCMCCRPDAKTSSSSSSSSSSSLPLPALLAPLLVTGTVALLLHSNDDTLDTPNTVITSPKPKPLTSHEVRPSPSSLRHGGNSGRRGRHFAVIDGL